MVQLRLQTVVFPEFIATEDLQHWIFRGTRSLDNVSRTLLAMSGHSPRRSTSAANQSYSAPMSGDGTAASELLVTLETTQRATNLTLAEDGLHVVSIETGVSPLGSD